MWCAVKRLGKIQKGDVDLLSVVPWFRPIVVTRKKLRKRWSALHVSKLVRVKDMLVTVVTFFHSRLHITAEHQDCPVFAVFLTIKTLSQNISITLLQFSLKLHEHRDGYWREKFLRTILEKQFPLPRNTGASKIGNGVISLLWKLRCHCSPDHNNFLSLCNAALWWNFFPNLCYM